MEINGECFFNRYWFFYWWLYCLPRKKESTMKNQFKNIVLHKDAPIPKSVPPFVAGATDSVTFNAIVSRYKGDGKPKPPKNGFLSPLKPPKSTIEGAARLTCGLLYDLLCMDPKVQAKFEASLSRELFAGTQAIYQLRGLIKRERELYRQTVEQNGGKRV